MIRCDGSGNKPDLASLSSANASEAKGGSQVAGIGADVFELYGSLMVADGRMTETRMRRAVDAYRKAVQR